ncbi:MAG: zinc ribbon domain-containing protein, partial [Leptospirillia bacterium]
MNACIASRPEFYGAFRINRSIHDVAWSQFFFFLSYKAESAGREFRKVNPAYTSQTCSSCGHRQKMPLSER